MDSERSSSEHHGGGSGDGCNGSEQGGGSLTGEVWGFCGDGGAGVRLSSGVLSAALSICTSSLAV